MVEIYRAQKCSELVIESNIWMMISNILETNLFGRRRTDAAAASNSYKKITAGITNLYATMISKIQVGVVNRIELRVVKGPKIIRRVYFLVELNEYKEKRILLSQYRISTNAKLICKYNNN